MNKQFAISEMSYLPQMHDDEILDVQYEGKMFWLILDHNMDDESTEKMKLGLEVQDDAIYDVQAHIYRINKKQSIRGKSVDCVELKKWLNRYNGFVEIVDIYVDSVVEGVIVRASACYRKKKHYLDILVYAKNVYYNME